MKLDRIQIFNFRSIKDQTFSFDRNFQILVGINESGKSNIIKAVSLLNGNVKISKNDIRDPGHDEGAVEDAYVKFVFKADSQLINKVFENAKVQILANSIDSVFLDVADKQMNIKEFCEYKNEVLYSVDLIKQKREMKHWRLSGPQYRIHKRWKKIKKGSSFDVGTPESPKDISDYVFINTMDYEGTQIPEEYLEDATITELNNFIGSILINVCSENIPTAILWEYSEENLLPGRISYLQFVSNPNMCAPLKNMFSLAGYDKPGLVLQEAEEKSNGIRNILRKVSRNTTEHMQSVWPEWKEQKVTLFQNGDFLETGIEDEFNVYSLSRRSDGFKRFFTFLLMISAQNKTENIYDNILLIDEPDIGLHPSGVQYLRDELNKISANNLVLVSTHSIFMIDKIIIDRHLIVKKKNEITFFEKAGSSNILDEEVIYKALGYSLFEILKPLNIIFEGWRDKNIFSMFSRSVPGKSVFDKSTASKVGLLHAMGVKDVGRVANICENVARKYLIITDSDKPSKEKKRQFSGSGDWLCYDEIEGVSAVTTEDFVKNKLINNSISYVLKQNDFSFKVVIPDEIERDKVKLVQDLLLEKGIEKQKVSNILNLIKEHICENAKAADLTEEYSLMCKHLVSAIMQKE